jgi:prolyl-tRNA synthetase
MNMTYLDQNGNTQYPIMGCYGIGIGRLTASVCEAHHDEFGPIWPMAIAPWQVHICAVRADNADVKKCADSLYEEMKSCGVEVIYDNRAVSAGVMFSDADLLGVPLRVIASPRNLKENCCEIISRDKRVNQKVRTDKVLRIIQDLINNM